MARRLSVALCLLVLSLPANAGGDGQIVLHRALDSHFYVAGAINGIPVVFMVDTGAARSALPASVSTRIFKTLKPGGCFVDTSNGRAPCWTAYPNSFELGGHSITLPNMIVVESTPSPLLGQDVLSRFDIDQRGDLFILRLR